jgi:hypothetical protein
MLEQTVNCIGGAVNCRIEKSLVGWHNYEQREWDNGEY